MSDDELQQLILKELRSINKTLRSQLRTNRCSTQIINLTVAHANEPLKISYEGRVYLFLDIERADSPFTYILGQTGNTKSEVFNSPTALFFHEFTEIFYTNAAAIGIAVLLTGWLESWEPQ